MVSNTKDRFYCDGDQIEKNPKAHLNNKKLILSGETALIFNVDINKKQ